ncbi:MAG: hypothetical protein KF861_21885, partial [Planctomycetaceae bacterium]|nr:hypothetical protein [Planctomycetaceae bacterium]
MQLVRLIIPGLACAWWLACGARVPCAAEAAPPAGVLTLDSGDTVDGVLQASADPNVIRWQGTAFTLPFEFEAHAVSSLHYPAVSPPAKPQGEFALELMGGDVLTGRFTDWSAENVGFDARHFGPLTIRREQIRRISRLDDNPLLIFPSLSGLTDWQVTSGEWREEGAHVWSNSEGAMLTGNLNLPEQAVIEFELSWTQTPNFVFAIGIDPQVAADDRRQGWRFESWRRVIAAVREETNVASVDHVQDLTKEGGRVHLMAFLDQSTGEMQVFRPDGTPSGKVAVQNGNVPRADKPAIGRGIRLVNRHGDIRLER